MPVGLKPQMHPAHVIGDALHQGTKWADNNPRPAFLIILLAVSLLCLLVGDAAPIFH